MSENKGLLSNFTGIIKSPKRTFNLIESKDFKKGFLIVLINAGLSVLAEFNYGMKMDLLKFLPTGNNFTLINPETFRRNLVTIISLFNGLGVIVGWFILSIIAYSISRSSSMHGGFKRLATLIGFTYLPLMFQQIIRVVDSYIIPEEFLNAYIQSRNQSYIGSLANVAVRTFSIFGIWTFILTVLAISNNSNLSIKKSILITIAIYSLYIILRTFLPI
ncbi:YIP1 family protein [Candidatus Bathyarchaeota archaeon]|nr:YIP1 family protein [Candidatus Bathyarchaeota archaeon]